MSVKNNNQPARRILAAKIATAHGIRGLVKLLVYTENPMDLAAYGPFHTAETGGKTISLHIKSSTGKYWLASIEGINDRTEAEKLRGTELWIDRDKLPTPEEGAYYYEDLIGLTVNGINGQPVGRVLGVSNFGAGDLLEIQPDQGDSYYLPFTEQYVPDVSLEKGTVTIAEDVNAAMDE